MASSTAPHNKVRSSSISLWTVNATQKTQVPFLSQTERAWLSASMRTVKAEATHRKEVAGVKDALQQVGHNGSPQLRWQLLQQLIVMYLCTQRLP